MPRWAWSITSAPTRPSRPCRARRAGPVNLAAALRHPARDRARPLATLGITPGAITHELRSRENAGALAPLLTRARSG
jgi:hypothetical protein